MSRGRGCCLYLLLGILILSIPTDSEAFFFRRLFSGIRARRAERFALPRQRFLINPAFFNPSVVACLNSVGGFGHGGGFGVDPRLCFLDPSLANPFIGALGSGFGRGSQCGQFRTNSCPNGGTAWACAGQIGQPPNGFGVEASGSNGCWAKENLQWEACRQGVDPSLIAQMAVGCWRKGGPPVPRWVEGTYAAGQAILAWNFGDESWQRLKGWLDKNNWPWTRFQGTNKVLIQVAQGGEAGFCEKAFAWNSSLVQFCSPNLFKGPEGGAGGGYGQYANGNVNIREPFDFTGGLGGGAY